VSDSSQHNNINGYVTAQEVLLTGNILI